MCERGRRLTDFRYFFFCTPVFSSPCWIQEVVLPLLDHVAEKRRPSGSGADTRQVCWLLLSKAIVFFVILFLFGLESSSSFFFGVGVGGGGGGAPQIWRFF
jgi:hypothetical protein